MVSAGAASPAVAAGWGALAGTALLTLRKFMLLKFQFYIIHYTGTVLGVGLSGTVNASMGLANKK